MKKVISAVALMGCAMGAQAATATLIKAETYHKGNPVAMSVKLAVGNTSTWDLDTVTGVATQTGGTFVAKLTTMFTHTMTGGVLGNAPAIATSWNCIEGTFGEMVLGQQCGNVQFGPNTVLDSIIGSSGVGTTVTLLGDDVALGPPQTLANSYSNMTLVSLGANLTLGGTNWRLSNRNAASTAGYTFDFNIQNAVVPVPAAVWLFGSALSLMGVVRRRAN